MAEIQSMYIVMGMHCLIVGKRRAFPAILQFMRGLIIVRDLCITSKYNNASLDVFNSTLALFLFHSFHGFVIVSAVLFSRDYWSMPHHSSITWATISHLVIPRLSLKYLRYAATCTL